MGLSGVFGRRRRLGGEICFLRDNLWKDLSLRHKEVMLSKCSILCLFWRL